MTESSPEKIYDKFRSSDNQIAFLMTDQGELSLDREIVKMMKDMRVDEIVQFADSFFSFTENQCQSLRDLVQKQLESRQFEVGGCGGVSKQSERIQNIQISKAQISNKHAKRDNQNKSLVKNLNNLPKILQQLQFALQENDQIGAEPVAQSNNDDKMQQGDKIDFDQFRYEQYKLEIDADDTYLTELTQTTTQHQQPQNLFPPNIKQANITHKPQPQQQQNHQQQQQPPSSIPTTIQQNSQLQFDQLQRIHLEENRYRITYNNGDIYEGQLENQMKNGEGEYYYSTGEKYSGSFVDDEINGYGRYYFLSGAEYQGDWSSGMKHGMGILKFVNGDQYQGNFVNDLFHGKGTYKYSKGDVFVGNWRSGLKHGKGKFQSIDGNMQIGTWVNDKFQI